MNDRLPTLRYRTSVAALLAFAFAPGCMDLTGDSSDAGASTGGASSGTGTELAAVCTTTFSACGGDITGTWDLVSICAETNPVDAVNQLNAKYPDCGNVCSAASMTASGFVTYSAQTMSSSLAFRMLESLSLSPNCFLQVFGTSLTESTCQSAGNDPASASSCSYVLANCACTFDQTTKDNATTYAVSGNEIVEYDPTALSQQAIQYCVSGTSMTQRRNLTPGINYVVTFKLRQ